MATKKIDLTTEEKIKEAARKIFTSKGFAATRTRDIAEEAGMNLALLNYYFRSKQKLFEIVMLENFQQFIGSIQSIINDTDTTLDEKLDNLVDFYIDQIIKYPDLPLFILNELKTNSKFLKGKIDKQVMLKSHFIQQVKSELIKNKKAKTNPLHIIFNTFSMILFPFVAKPFIMEAALTKNEDFIALMNERKKMIPGWIKTMIRG